jgi:hypothetical protein
MWNRVVLLASGVAFGWTLVHLVCAPRSELDKLRVRLVLSLLAGSVVVVLLWRFDPASGLMGSAVFIASAAVAYAANAKQVSKQPVPLLPRGLGVRPVPSAQVGVLLAIDAEPATYDGPAYWARLMRRSQAHGQAVPHWLVRPWAYGRIRGAYASASDRQTLVGCVAALGDALGEGFRVQHAHLLVGPAVRDALGEWADAGIRQMIVIPLGLSPEDSETCRDQIALSRVRERGVRVAIADTLDRPLWQAGTPESRLESWLSGRAPAQPPDSPLLVEALVQVIHEL